MSDEPRRPWHQRRPERSRLANRSSAWPWLGRGDAETFAPAALHVHPTPKAPHEVQRGFLRDVVIGQGAPILELLPCKDEALLVARCAVRRADHHLDAFDRHGRRNGQVERLSRQRLHVDGHGADRGGPHANRVGAAAPEEDGKQRRIVGAAIDDLGGVRRRGEEKNVEGVEGVLLRERALQPPTVSASRLSNTRRGRLESPSTTHSGNGGAVVVAESSSPPLGGEGAARRLPTDRKALHMLANEGMARRLQTKRKSSKPKMHFRVRCVTLGTTDCCQRGS
jgi:hypothetical protein